MFEHDEPDYEFSADVPGERLDKRHARVPGRHGTISFTEFTNGRTQI